MKTILAFFLNKKVNHFIQFLHKLSTRRNRIVLEILLTIRALLIVAVKSLDKLFIVSGTLEPSGSLVVHFRSWSDTIQGEEDHFIRLEDIDNGVDVIEYLNPDFFKLFRHDLSFKDDGVVLDKIKMLP